MALFAARMAGLGARRFFPSAFNYARRAYMSNPRAFARVASGAARAGAVGAMALTKRNRTPSRGPNKRRYAMPATPAKSPARGRTMSRDTSSSRSSSVGKRKRYAGYARSAGKFKRATSRINTDIMYLKHGMSATQEVHGVVEDPDCVFLGHSAQVAPATIYNIVSSLFRKLFNDCVKFECLSLTQEIPGLTFDNTSVRYKLVLLSKNANNNNITTTHTWISSDNSTLTSVTNDFNGFFKSYSSGTGTYQNNNDANRLEPYKIQLYQLDVGVSEDFWNFQGEINLNQVMVHVKCVSSMKVQNRSLGANGGTQADDVTNNPLIGKRYICNGVPKTRDLHFQQIVTNKGVKLLRAAQCDDSMYKEPPRFNHFVNIKKGAGVQLQPGEIKYSKLYFKKSMGLLTLLRYLHANEDSVGDITNNVGPFELFALEDMINVNADQVISVCYEVNRVTSSYCTYKKKNISNTSFEQAEYDNVVV